MSFGVRCGRSGNVNFLSDGTATMSESDRKTQDYHKAIKNVVEHLKSKRTELQDEIGHDQLEKSRVLGEMSKLQDKLSILDANLRKKSEFRKEYDKAITQSEENFVELLRKSEEFLTLTRREALALSHAVGDSAHPSTADDRPARKEEAVRQKPRADPSSVLFSFEAFESPTPKKEPPSGKCPGCPVPVPVPSSIPGPGPGNCTTIIIPYRANGL